MKKYIKKKTEANQPGPKYRTPDHFSPRNQFGKAGKGSKFAGKGKVKSPQAKFNPAQFKVQHKG